MKIKMALIIFAFVTTPALAQDDASVVQGPVMMELPFEDMYLKIEYVAGADFDKLTRPSWISGHLYFFTEGYPQSERYKDLDADTIFEKLNPGEAFWVVDQFRDHSSSGWRLAGMLPIPACPEDDVLPCEAGSINTNPNVMAVIGRDLDGCRGDTLMTGYSKVSHELRKARPPYDIHTAHEPVKDVHWMGRLNGPEEGQFFLATLISPFPVTADERRDIMAEFSKTCGLE